MPGTMPNTDPGSSTKPVLNKRHHAVAHRLPRLPRELVHEIFSSLSLQKVLEIICNHDLPYLDQCLVTHINYGKVIPADTLPTVKEYFTLYSRIRAHDKRNPYPNIEILEKDAEFFAKAMYEKPDPGCGRYGGRRPLRRGRGTNAGAVRVAGAGEGKPPAFARIIRDEIIRELKRVAPFFPVLSAFVDPGPVELPRTIPGLEFWDSDSPTVLREMFDLVEGADRKLGTIKAEQLQRMAELLECYSNWVHPCVEKNEAQRRTRHQVEYLRREAKVIGETPEQVMSRKWVGRVVFAQKQFYLVPYDRVLRVFLKVLEKFPPASIDIAGPMDAEATSQAPSENESQEARERAQLKKKKSPTRPPHDYPQSLRLKFVLEGLASQFPRHSKEDPSSTPPRAIHTIYSLPGRRTAGGAHQPSFFIYLEHPCPRRMKKWEGIWPMQLEEFEWLEAFLEVCQYMARMKEAWTIGRTVEDYWKVNVGHAKNVG